MTMGHLKYESAEALPRFGRENSRDFPDPDDWAGIMISNIRDFAPIPRLPADLAGISGFGPIPIGPRSLNLRLDKPGSGSGSGDLGISLSSGPFGP